MKATLYHNPRCSKSRQAKELLETHQVDFTIREYLKEPLNKAEIKSLLTALAVPAHDLLRVKEAEYNDHNLNKNSSQTDIIAALVETPKLLERPIVVTDKGARIGRPTESILEIL